MNKIDINQKPDQSINITLNYPELRIDNPQESKRKSTNNLGKLIKATFIGKPNEPNVIYSKTGPPQNCQAQNLYIYGKLHDINVDYDGELIIQNQAQTTQQIIYTIFLLKTGSSIFNNPFDTTLDTFLKNQSSTTLDINSLINQIPDSYIVYSDQSTIVIIDTNVITIKTDLSEYTSQINLFNANPTKYSIVHSSNMSKKSVDKLVEGFSIDPIDSKLKNDDTDGDYLVCDNLPIGSEEELNYMLPANSQVINNIAQNSFFTTVITYICALSVFIFVSLVAPIIYEIPYNISDSWFSKYLITKMVTDNPSMISTIINKNFFSAVSVKYDDNAFIWVLWWFCFLITGWYTKINGLLTNQGFWYTAIFTKVATGLIIWGIMSGNKTYWASGIMIYVCYLIGFIAIKNKDTLQTKINTGGIEYTY